MVFVDLSSLYLCPKIIKNNIHHAVLADQLYKSMFTVE